MNGYKKKYLYIYTVGIQTGKYGYACCRRLYMNDIMFVHFLYLRLIIGDIYVWYERVGFLGGRRVCCKEMKRHERLWTPRRAPAERSKLGRWNVCVYLFTQSVREEIICCMNLWLEPCNVNINIIFIRAIWCFICSNDISHRVWYCLGGMGGSDIELDSP